MLKKSLLAVALAFASSGAFAAAETYVMDNNHTQVEFSWNHFGFSNPVANFDNIEGSINYDADDITVPFGGFKQSGTGRDKSLHAFDKYTELKTTWIDLSQ